MMNTKEKNQGPDGIQLWNFVFPQLKDYDQTTILVKELTELKIKDLSKIQQLINSWVVSVRLTNGVIDDAVEMFKLDAMKYLQPGQ